MPKGPAARLGDPVQHPTPPILTGGPASPDVTIGYKPAWRGVPAAAAQALQAARKGVDTAVQSAEAATKAASGTPGAPAALAAEVTAKTAAVSSMGAAMKASMADMHNCAQPSPTAMVPHGPGVIIDGSPTVFINFLPACREGDTILEPLGPPNKVALGEQTVIIGD